MFPPAQPHPSEENQILTQDGIDELIAKSPDEVSDEEFTSLVAALRASRANYTPTSSRSRKPPKIEGPEPDVDDILNGLATGTLTIRGKGTKA